MKALCVDKVGSVGRVSHSFEGIMCQQYRQCRQGDKLGVLRNCVSANIGLIGRGVGDGNEGWVGNVGIVGSSGRMSVRATKAVPATSTKGQLDLS